MANSRLSHNMGTSSIPAFLVKLVNLLEDNENNDIITWNHDGNSFHIYDQSRLAKEVLPLYFKHNNIASFIRQLNMYGFRKMAEHTGIKMEHEDLQFAHPYFIRGRDDLLDKIKRKVSMPAGLRPPEEPKLSKDDVHKVLSEVRDIKNKQDHVTNKIHSLKRENEALWREVASLRQKHVRQQTVVNKLISFLVRVVGSRGMAAATKRKLMPLMLESSTPSEQGPSRRAKSPRQYYDVEMPTTPYMRGDSSGSVNGITIQEVQSPPSVHQQDATDESENFNFDEPAMNFVNFEHPDDLPSVESSLSRSDGFIADMLDDPVVIANARQVMAENLGEPVTTSFNPAASATNQTAISPTAAATTNIGSTVNVPVQQYQRSSSGGKKGKMNKGGALKLKIEPMDRAVANASPTRAGEEALDQLTMALPKSIASQGPFTPDIIDGHLDGVQYDLDSIKDLLSGGYNLETDTLLKIFTAEQIKSSHIESLFNTDDSVASGADHMVEDSNGPVLESDRIMGHELIQFSNPPDDLSMLFDLGDVPPVDPNDIDDLDNGELNTPLVTPLSGDSLQRTTSFTHNPSPIKFKGKMEEVD